jgi:hypothetical protein
MVGTFASIYDCEEVLHIRKICISHIARLEIAHWGDDYSVAHPAEYFLRGVPAIGSCPGRHCAVRCCEKALRSIYIHFRLGERLGLSHIPILGGE